METLNAGSPIYTSGLLTGPIIVLATQASKFKCGIVKIYVSADNTLDSYAYIGMLSANQLQISLDIAASFYIRAELHACDGSEVTIFFLTP